MPSSSAAGSAALGFNESAIPWVRCLVVSPLGCHPWSSACCTVQHWSSGLFRPLGKLLPAPFMSLQRGQPLNKKLFTFVNTSENETRAGAADGLEPVPSRWSLVPSNLLYKLY